MKLQPEKRASLSCQAAAVEEDEIEKVENLGNGHSVSRCMTVGPFVCFGMTQTLKFHPRGKTTWLNLELTSRMPQKPSSALKTSMPLTSALSKTYQWSLDGTQGKMKLNVLIRLYSGS